MIGGGILLIIWGLATAVTGDEANDYPAYVESVSPIPNAEQTPRQTQIVIDLATGYQGTLTIDDTEIPVVSQAQLNASAKPGQQVDLPPAAIYEAGNATIRFTPSDESAIESFTPGRHTVQIIYWKTEEGRDKARSFSWDFEVI